MRRNDNEIKYNNILFWAKNDDWGQKAITADKNVLFTDQSAQKSKDLELEPVDFHIEGYIYGEDTQAKVAKLYKAFATKKTGILEHKDIGKVRVKFAEGGFRFKRVESKYNYYELTLDLKVANDAALNIQVVEVQEVKEEQLKSKTEIASQSFLEAFDEKFTFEGFPNLVKMQTFENLTSISGKLSRLTANNLIGDILDPITGSWDILATAAGGIGAVLQSYLDFTGNKKNKYRAYMDLAAFDPELSKADISGHEQIAINTEACVEIIKQTALIKACELIDSEVFDSKKEIEEAADELIDASNHIAFATDNKTVQDHIFTTVHLAVVVLRALPAGNTRTITRNVRLPAIVIAYEEGCDEDEFIRHNNIRHPLFVDAGVPLEVTDAGN
jgi:hypothetical protein|nr:MAG TPA: DNA circularization protein [Caudoviricetes sp.]